MFVKMNNEINCIKTPYECLFHKSLDFNHLHAFGCLCYPWLRLYTKNKLKNRFVKCVFLGYSMQHKGYKC
jgi:histone deacetylase 1/2